MDLKTELDDVGMSIGVLMSKVVRRCRGDEIGHASKLPLCMLHRMADEATDIAMEFLSRLNAWEMIEERMPEETMEIIFVGLIKDAAKRALKLEAMLAYLDQHEAPLHIIRDKRIR